MEIERKFLIKKENLPENLASYPCHRIEQGYLCTSPVVRIRRQDDDYFLTYKSKGLMSREEYNLPLTAEAYEHLKPKAPENQGRWNPHHKRPLRDPGKRRTFYRTGYLSRRI